MRVVVVGMGETGRELASNLGRKKDNELVLIDQDDDRCETLSSDFDALVIHGDGSDPEILKKAQVPEADALVALTGSDPINTVIAMLGHLMEVPKIIVKLNTYGFRAACQEIGVEAIIAPKIAAAAEIVSALFGFDRINFSSIASGGLRLDLVAAGKKKGKKISDLDIPDGAHLVAVLREEDQMFIPKKNLSLEKEDQILLLTEDNAALEKVRKAFDSDDRDN
jgi:trk system potassium uptake protein